MNHLPWAIAFSLTVFIFFAFSASQWIAMGAVNDKATLAEANNKSLMEKYIVLNKTSSVVKTGEFCFIGGDVYNKMGTSVDVDHIKFK